MKKLKYLPLLLLAACTHTSGQEFEVGAVDSLKTGHSTSTQVEAVLGQPYRTQIKADGTETWEYELSSGTATLTAQAFIPYVGVFLPNSQKASFEHKRLALDFENNVLTSCLLTLRSGEGRGNAAFQSGVNESLSSSHSKEIVCGEGQ